LLAEDVRAGLLMPLLKKFDLPSRPMHIVYLKDRRPTAKLRSFVEFVAARFAPLLNDR
jgi:DNA-binding transcriptional LysR family regulator